MKTQEKTPSPTQEYIEAARHERRDIYEQYGCPRRAYRVTLKDGTVEEIYSDLDLESLPPERFIGISRGSDGKCFFKDQIESFERVS